jgi:phage tail sheath protein FI
MPEYLAPGVFVEEVSYRAKTIEGVSTTTTGFVGSTRFGPIDGDLEVLTSLGDYERTYGDGQELHFSDPGGGDLTTPNFMWQAVRAFFDQGGRRLYVKRVFRPGDAASEAQSNNPAIPVQARFPGAAAAGAVRFTLTLGPNVLSLGPGKDAVLNGVQDNDVVWLSETWLGSPPDSPPHAPRRGDFYLAASSTDPSTGGWTLTRPGDVHPSIVNLAQLSADVPPQWRDEVRILTLTLTYLPDAPGALPVSWSGLPLDPSHRTGGAADSVFAIFAKDPPSRALARTIPLYLESDSFSDGLDLLLALEHVSPDLGARVADPKAKPEERTAEIRIEDGNDGALPTSAEFEGDDRDIDNKTGLKAFEDIDDISIVAAPGATFRYEYGGPQHQGDIAATVQALIGHAEKMRYRIAVLDSGDQQDVTSVSAMRGTIDSAHAAFYYPWVTVFDAITRAEISLPPSGFVCGIYARNDIERAVYKAPANEVVTGAIGFEKVLNKAQQEVLNPLGVNCFRFFEGRGFRLWGARTASSDPEWKYVNVRRYFAYLEHSIDKGTQWAVFEPNGEALWANVRRTVSDFLFNEFQSGALLGDKPEVAYFVKCDRSTMTQNDLDNGRLVCEVGVAVLRPAEFVIFRIGQWTADRKS